MNIKKSFWALLCTGIFFFNASTFAKQSININESFAFHPVKWHLNIITGGFSIQNQTTKNQFVQIVLNTGSITVFKLINNELSCENALGGNSVSNSAVCELAPGESLHINLDYQPLAEATGTYQIKMGK